jgi:hypothetical protein
MSCDASKFRPVAAEEIIRSGQVSVITYQFDTLIFCVQSTTNYTGYFRTCSEHQLLSYVTTNKEIL